MSWGVRRFAWRVFAFPIAALVLVVVTVPSVAVADPGRRINEGEAWSGRFGVPDWTSQDPPANRRHLMNVPYGTATGQDVDTTPTTGSRQEPSWLARAGPPNQRHTHLSRSPSLQPTPSTDGGALDYAQIALGGLAGFTIAAAIAGKLAKRRRRQPPLEAALASGEPDELPRAAGLLGDLFAQLSRPGAAEHAYRAAIDADHPYWSPVAQVALAQLFSDCGNLDEAQRLLEDAIAAGDTRTAPIAHTALRKLNTGDCLHQALAADETLDKT